MPSSSCLELEVELRAVEVPDVGQMLFAEPRVFKGGHCLEGGDTTEGRAARRRLGTHLCALLTCRCQRFRDSGDRNKPRDRHRMMRMYQ